MRSVLIFVLFLCCSASAYAQVVIQGVLTHEEEPLSQVTIQVYENDKLQRTLAASKRGRFETEFPFGHEYLLVFRRPYMIPSKILVNTQLMAGVDDKALQIEVPLDMQLFYRYAGMEVSAYANPIGEIKNIGSGNEAFSFIPNARVIAEVKKVNDESKRREAKQEEPIDSELSDPLLSDYHPSIVESDHEKAIVQPENEPKVVFDRGTEPEAETDASEVKTDRTAQRHEKVAESKNLQLEHERDLKQSEKQKAVDRTKAQQNYLVTDKTGKQQMAEDRQEAIQEVVTTKVLASEAVLRDAEVAASKTSFSTRSLSTSMVPIRKSQTEGWMISQEYLVVSINGAEQCYEKVIYDWFLFEAVYYYKNEEEISENVYVAVAKLFK